MAVAVLDIDGTLVDTNYHHAIAWYRAFREHGIVLPVWRIHRHIGMGGDQLVAALTDDHTEQEHGDEIRDTETKRYFELIDEVGRRHPVGREGSRRRERADARGPDRWLLDERAARRGRARRVRVGPRVVRGPGPHAAGVSESLR